MACSDVSVPDYPAINACHSAADIKIKGIKQTIHVCKTEISGYENLKKDITVKMGEAIELQHQFVITDGLINDARLNIDMRGCDNCMEGLIKTYEGMIVDCNHELDVWNAKLAQAEKDLVQAESDKQKCNFITKTVRVCTDD